MIFHGLDIVAFRQREQHGHGRLLHNVFVRTVIEFPSLRRHSMHTLPSSV